MADCNIAQTVKKTYNKIPSSYVMTMGELSQLYEIYEKSSVINAVIHAYRFGFARGTRAKAKKRVSTL